MDRIENALPDGERPLRIAQIAGVAFRVPPRGTGGTEIAVAHLTRGLVDRGHRVTLFASGDSRTDAELRSVTPVAAQDDPDSNLYRERELELRNVDEAYGRSGDFDVIHAHWPTPAAYFSEHGRCPTLLTFDYMEKEIFEDYRSRFPRLRFACVSRAQADALGAGLPVVPNGIDVDAVPFGRVPGRYLITVGRLVPTKGAAIAIEVARRAALPLVVVGDVSPYLPESREYFEKEIAPRVDGRSVVHFPRLSNRRVLELLSGARALLFPVRWDEPFGMVVAESLAAGTPVVATPRGSIPELVDEGTTGWLAEDLDGLVSAVARVGAIDRRRCRAAARSRFDFRRAAEAYEELYRKIAREWREEPSARRSAWR
ncbi:MAG TPA: glycosyltransferase family 4 protein [Thermoanaerobaculia bacterium]|nr:glycosyltransferase family 4 protein [Thermoanaerobaculia bacterium]